MSEETEPVPEVTETSETEPNLEDECLDESVPTPSSSADDSDSENSPKPPSTVLRSRSTSVGKVAPDQPEVVKRKRNLSSQEDSSASGSGTATSEPDGKEEPLASEADDPTPASSGAGPLPKRRKSIKSDNMDLANDIYCWVCHKEFITGQPIGYCKSCPRSYHTRCIPNMDLAVHDNVQPGEPWTCPECLNNERAEGIVYRSQAMHMVSLDQLCTLLKFSLGRMKVVPGAEPFLKPVDPVEFPRYSEFVVNPMDLSQLERNVRRKLYGCTEAFLADAKWILHNSIVFNTCQAKLTTAARTIVKACKQEMAEIENCPDCYLHAHTLKDSWFIEVCRRPHLLVWAKLKGFPFWPAKAMKVNKEGAVDVRFFGAHDRAWVPIRDCFLYSKEIPVAVKPKKRINLDICIAEVEQHTIRLKERFGAFVHAPFRTPFEPENQEKQLSVLLPNYCPPSNGKRARTVLHPEITPRASAKSATQGSSTPTATSGCSSSSGTESPAEKSAKEEKLVVTVTRSGRMSLAPKNKSSPAARVRRSNSVSQSTNKDANSQDGEKNSKSHDEPDKKRSEEREIGAIIQASKAMEETLAITSPQGAKKPSDDVEAEDDDEDDEELNESQELEGFDDTIESVAEDDASSSEVLTPDENDGDTSSNLCPSSPLKKSGEESGGEEGLEEQILEEEVAEEEMEDETEDKDDVEEEEISDKPVEEEMEEAEEAADESAEIAEEKPPPQKEAKKEKTREREPKPEESKPPAEKRSPAKIVPKLCLKLPKQNQLQSKNNEVDIRKTSISRSPASVKDKPRAVPGLLSADRKLDSFCEVEITPIPKKRKATAPSKEKPSEEVANSPAAVSEESDEESVTSKKKRREEGKKSGDDDERCSNSRNSNPDDDSIFPSLFLDPSVTITVVENSAEKKASSAAEVVKELCSSVSLSSDVSLTIVEKNRGNQESRSNTASPVTAPSSAEGSKKPIPALHGKSKARKTPFAMRNSDLVPIAPKQLISVKNPSSMMVNGRKSPPEVESNLSAMQKEVGISPAPTTGQSLLNNAPPQPPHPHHPLSSGSMRPPLRATGHGSMPQLQPRPFTGHMGTGPPPDTGPATTELNKHATKLTEYVRQSLEGLMRDLSAVGSPQATIGSLQLEIERMQWRHQQELAELKHNTDLNLMEMRASMESERARALADLRRQADIERQRVVEETKKKQWCAFCNKEALFYCCWNTSYCDYPCQQAHWPRHMATCAQKYSKDGNSSSGSPNPSGASKAPFHGSTSEAALDGTMWGSEADEDSLHDSFSMSPSLGTSNNNNNNATAKKSKWAGKRKRCGHCDGCLITDNCGTCPPCKNSRTHQVCKERRCRTLGESERQQRWLANSSSNTSVTAQSSSSSPQLQLQQQSLSAQLVKMAKKAQQVQKDNFYDYYSSSYPH